MSLRLFERQTELQSLASATQSARQGRGRLVVLRGQAGIGKSCLLQVAIDTAAAEGMMVLSARAGHLEHDFAFGVALSLFEARLAGAPAAQREAWLTGAAGLTRPLFAQETVPALSGPDGTDSAFSLFHGLYWLAANMAASRGLVLTVDDAHWADELSLRALLYLTQRLEELPIALLVATRPAEPGTDADLLAELAAHPVAQVVEPAPLSWGAVEIIVRGHFPSAADEFCQVCASVTGGNPFLLDELLRALDTQGVAPDRNAVNLVRRLGPESISRAVLLRLARLPAGAVTLARAVAVLGDDCDLGLAATLAGLDPGEAANLADRLVTVGILQQSSSLSFVHPVVESAIATETPHGQQARFHAMAARRLHQTNAPVARTAVHLLAAPPAGKSWVVDLLLASARLALSEGAPDIAVRHLRRALAEPPTSQRRTDVLRELGMAEARNGLPGGADHLEEAARSATEPHQKAALYLDTGRTLYWLGRNIDAAAAFDEGIAALAGRDDPLTAELHAAWVHVATTEGSLRGEGLRRLGPILEQVPDTPTERSLLAQIALERTLLGQPREGPLALARRAWDEGRLMRHETADGISPYLVAAVLTWSDELDEGVEVLNALLEQARSRGSVMAFASASAVRAQSYYFQGRLLDAIADLQAALDARRYGWESFAAAACWGLALSQLARGDLVAAEAAVTVEADAERRWQDTFGYALLLAARASVASARHRHQVALDLLLDAGRLLTDKFGVTSPAVLDWRSQAALASASTGARSQALALAEEEVALARVTGSPRAIGVALRAEGLVMGGRPGLDRLIEATETLAGSPSRLEHARALVDMGAAMRRESARQAAREPLRQGLDLAERSGASVLAERARQELMIAGARPRRALLTGIDSLTGAERRAATLAGSGLSNRDIAEALFVTPKTVEYHLRNVFAKLHVSSRAELAAIVSAELESSGHPRAT